MKFIVFILFYILTTCANSALLGDEVPKDTGALSITRTGPCSAKVKGYGEINLEPLKRSDGLARYSTFCLY